MNQRGAAAYLITIVAGVAALTACSLRSTSINVDEAGGHRLLAHTRTPGAAGTAAITELLSLSGDSCLGIGSGDSFSVVFFPNETHWLTPTTVSINGQKLTIGDSLTLGGGGTDSPDAQTTVQRYCPSSLARIWDTG